MEKKATNNTYILQGRDTLGEITISDDVVAMIAGLAALEVEGVASLAGSATSQILERVGRKNLSKGVRVEMEDQTAKVEMAVTLKFGYHIMDVSMQIQDKVISAIETMTGLKVANVNIRVAAVDVNS